MSKYQLMKGLTDVDCCGADVCGGHSHCPSLVCVNDGDDVHENVQSIWKTHSHYQNHVCFDVDVCQNIIY